MSNLASGPQVTTTTWLGEPLRCGCLRNGLSRRGSGLEHPDLAGVREHAARLDDRGHLAQRLEPPALAGGEVVQQALGHVDAQLVARADRLAQALGTLERHEVAAVDRVAEEDAGVE